MSKDFDYTTYARDVSLKYPMLSFILVQINFWVIAFLLLNTVAYFNGMSITSSYGINTPMTYNIMLASAVIIGIICGVLLGITDYLLEKYLSPIFSMGLVILARSLVYYVVLALVLVFIRFVLFEALIEPYFMDMDGVEFTEESWRYFYLMYGTYTIVLVPAISFINQMNKKFGPGILLPMLLGRYRKPIAQDRLFMVVDLKSSTTIAEKLGHLKYSQLIQSCFMDINKVLFSYRAEIYHYVGDEIVVSWNQSGSFKADIALDFFMACCQRFENRRDFYEKKYGVFPIFKCGIHMGPITAVEVGDIKRELAYHGDTINTTSRIQGLCNKYETRVLMSEEVKKNLVNPENYDIENKGEISLRGKENVISLYGLNF